LDLGEGDESLPGIDWNGKTMMSSTGLVSF
jgi:hypothetical protein